MKERPILFSGEMVRAILDGRKTQTRRPVKHQHLGAASNLPCPFGLAGDRLWVRETWQHGTDVNGVSCVVYKADGKALGAWANDSGEGDFVKVQGETDPMPCPIWRPSIHMPRWASRLTLVIINVRVQRLQDISTEDCRAEGQPKDNNDVGVRYGFGQLWNKIYEHQGTGWDANPWVWAIDFRKK